MKLLITFILLFFTAVTAQASCEVVENDTYKSYQEFLQAETLLDEKKFSEAYDALLKSYAIYENNETKINLDYECTNYIPGPYAPIIKKSTKKEEFDFERKALGIVIKHQLSPAPYALVEYQKDRTIVSVINTIKTSRNNIPKRLPLEKFTLKIAGDTYSFPLLEVGKLQQKSKPVSHSQDEQIQTSEAFNFALYK